MEEAKKDMGEVGVRDLEEDIETTRPVTQNFDERRRREEKKGGGGRKRWLEEVKQDLKQILEIKG